MEEPSYNMLYEHPKLHANTKILYCYLGSIAVLLVIILFLCLIILFSIGGAAVEASKCDNLAEKVEKMETKIYPLIDNVTQLLPLLINVTHLLNDTGVDMSAFAIVSRVVVKNRKEIENFFPFLNQTQNFIQDSKKCMQKYDICPSM